MSEKEKQVNESLTKIADKLNAKEMQRLSDIAYGMMLAKEGKQEQDNQTA